MTINFENDRPAFTYLPDMIDEATGEPIEGTGMVTETHRLLLPNKNNPNLDPTYDPSKGVELTDEQYKRIYHVDDVIRDEELNPVVLADVSAEIHESNVSYDPEMATAVLQAPMSDSPADVTVQFLAHKVYNGDITAEDAFNQALMSGINLAELITSYDILNEQCE